MTELVRKIKEEVADFNEQSFIDTLEVIVLVFVFVTTTYALAPIV